MSARIDPASKPYPDYAQERLARLAPPGGDPLVLFTTLATDQRLFERFFGGGLLDRGHLTLKQREIVIERITARCGSEYEWGVHVSGFAEKAGLTREQIASTCGGGPEDGCWTEEESCLIRLCDRIDADCTLGDEDWKDGLRFFTPPALFEILMLCGYYRTVSYITNGLGLPLEAWAARFSQYGAANGGGQ
ncbi:carboxymuconolactone decarboxylase family protein [Streptomyces glomeratus]|uniref:Carboxymuconolactone decarboxylase family protein n=1 Tax=Streptomyces glomeratus TaxID=284452 RepID=A0ABP6LGH7_9ACTN|nr:carboxymuconolactone decarboxylase family protein [Streptomyces glomeratus]MCF1512701.1 carboxymuconolactone decarboxylase family protein [Streptomyces glomeratus]